MHYEQALRSLWEENMTIDTDTGLIENATVFDLDVPRPGGGERLLRGPRAHSVVWVINDDSIEGVVQCNAVEGADCRMWCPDGCESWNLTDHEHTLVDYGSCLFVEWMDNASDGVLGAHRGSHAVESGCIQIEWDDDAWTWSYSFDA